MAAPCLRRAFTDELLTFRCGTVENNHRVPDIFVAPRWVRTQAEKLRETPQKLDSTIIQFNAHPDETSNQIINASYHTHSIKSSMPLTRRNQSLDGYPTRQPLFPSPQGLGVSLSSRQNAVPQETLCLRTHPALRRFRAMAVPMIPRPQKPTGAAILPVRDASPSQLWSRFPDGCLANAATKRSGRQIAGSCGCPTAHAQARKAAATKRSRKLHLPLAELQEIARKRR